MEAKPVTAAHYVPEFKFYTPEQNERYRQRVEGIIPEDMQADEKPETVEDYLPKGSESVFCVWGMPSKSRERDSGRRTTMFRRAILVADFDSGRWLGDMVRRQDERAFDMCLYLLRFPPGFVTLDYDAAAVALGMDGMSRLGYRRQINKTLRKLQNAYGLARVRLHRGRDARVALNAALFSVDETGRGQMPDAYWDYGWNKALGFSGKVMLVMNLAYGGWGMRARSWSRADSTLARRHGLSKDFLSEGTTQLRRWHLLDVGYSAPGPGGYAKRQANLYTLRELYDVRREGRQLRALERKYGAAKLRRAKSLAALVYDDHDVKGMEALIKMESSYGPGAMRKAAAIMKLKNPDNSKRSMGYLIGTIRGLGLRRK